MFLHPVMRAQGPKYLAKRPGVENGVTEPNGGFLHPVMPAQGPKYTGVENGVTEPNGGFGTRVLLFVTRGV